MNDFPSHLGFTNLDPITSERLQDLGAETVMNWALVRLSNLAGKDVASKASMLLETESYEALNQFTAEHGIDFNRLVLEASNDLKEILQQSGRIVRGER